MGMLFGGWAKDDDEDWNKKVEQYKIEERIRISKTINEPQEFINGIGIFDIICTWNKELNKAENQMYVTKIKDGKIFGILLSKGDGKTIEYPFKNYMKICSIFKKN
ncbi:hypothetical protein ACVMMT_23790 [Salmonella enterica]